MKAGKEKWVYIYCNRNLMIREGKRLYGIEMIYKRIILVNRKVIESLYTGYTE